MGVGRDGELDAGLFRGMDMDVVQVEPVRLGVDLEMAPQVASRDEDAIHVDVVGFALADQPPGRMAEDGHVGGSAWRG